MSRWRPERVVLGLGAERLAGPGGPAPAPAAGWDAGSLQAAFGIALQGAARPGRAVLVLLAPDLCKHFVQQAPAGLQSLAELQELANLRAAQLFGGSPEGWAVVADWRLDTPFACAALPLPLLQGLRAGAAAQQAALEVESAVLVVLERVLRGREGGGFVAWATPRHSVLVHVQGSAVHGLRCLRRPADADVDAFMAELQREVAREALLAGDPDTRLELAHPVARLRLADPARGVMPERLADFDEADWARELGPSP